MLFFCFIKLSYHNFSTTYYNRIPVLFTSEITFRELCQLICLRCPFPGTETPLSSCPCAAISNELLRIFDIQRF